MRGRTWCAAAAAVTAAMAGQGAPAVDLKYPQATLSNRVLAVQVYLPDATNGFYRGARFDWSGMIRQATYDGHTFFSELKGPHNPTAHDHGVGPVEEFGMAAPLGFDEAKTNETFIKIGVGHLLKTSPKYVFHGRYPIQKPAGWDVTRSPSQMVFVQRVNDERGWGYEYTKTVAIASNSPALYIHHTLRNTGTVPIDTEQYNHAMFRIDGDPVGALYRVEFAFSPQASTSSKATVDGHALKFVDPVLKGSFWTQVDGARTAEDSRVTVLNLRTGASLRMSVDRPPSKYAVYAERTAVCPEPFIRLFVPPGGMEVWTTRIEFAAPGVAGAPAGGR